MQTYIMLTRLMSEEVHPSFSMCKKEENIANKIKSYCPDVEWVEDYAILGPWDYIDIFRAPNMAMAMQVAALVRYYGGTHTEIWPAVDWDNFKENMQDLSDLITRDLEPEPTLIS